MDCMDKSCVADVSEECKAKSLLVECNCVPWEMPGFEVEFCQKEKNLNHFIASNQQVHWGEVKCYLQLPNIWSRNLCWYHPVGWRVHKGDNERSDPTFDNWIRELKTEQFQTCQIWFFCKCNCVWYVKNGVKSVWIRFSGSDLPSSRLHIVQIQFSTPTFDDIERDKKIKMEGQLSLIGGTMGLFTGFSIISGVEIVFFILRSN